MQYALYYRLMQRSFLDTIFAAEILMDCCYRFIVLPMMSALVHVCHVITGSSLGMGVINWLIENLSVNRLVKLTELKPKMA